MTFSSPVLATQDGAASQATETTQDVSPKDSLRALVESVNIAETIGADTLKSVGIEAKEGYDNDRESRNQWEKDIDEWTKLATQVREERSWPWPRASNVKYPLLATASMQFAARAYPSLIPSDGKVVKTKVIGKDPTGEKAELAARVSSYMSYQIMYEMDCWEEEMDKMLIMLPVVGTMFKKTYWDGVKKRVVSDLIMPKDLVVNYWAKSLKDAERISQVYEMSERVLKERQRSGIFLDVNLGSPNNPTEVPMGMGSVPALDATTPYIIIEQHTYLDLDDDGYKEPYIVTFHEDSGTVLRIVARYDDTTMFFNDDGDLIKIDPIQYYTKFGFIPNPNGCFYDIGFGELVGPLNESVNTLINQLIDAGTLNNLQSGFIGKGLRLRMGENRFNPGEWKAVNATGDDLKKQIVPLPSKEPSDTLFQLMGSLITSGKELASVAEIFVGKMPGQNTPATTTMATIEQGMKVFTAVYKRLYRALEDEFKKIYYLDAVYIDPNTYQDVVDVAVGPDDFKAGQYQICPGSDPTAVSQTEKLLKAQGLLELLPTGMLDPIEVVKRVLEAQEQPNYERLFNKAIQESGAMPPPPPDPKLLEMQMKGQLDQQGAALKAQEAAFKSELAARDQQFQHSMQQQKMAQEARHKESMALIDAATKEHMQKIFSAEGVQKIVQKDMEHTQKMRQSDEQNAAKVAAQKQNKGASKK